ncbi:MAG: ABC transporter substrate-binding protein [Sumerlaeia bacterium]
MVWRLIPALLCLSLLSACSGDGEGGVDGERDPVRFNSVATGEDGQLIRTLVSEFEASQGIPAAAVHGPYDVTERLTQYRMFLSAGATTFDVYQIDIIWPGTLSESFVDLGAELGQDRDDFFPALIENNTVGGKLVAVPWYGGVGVLFYRTDLLEKYGYGGPPETWDELEVMARTIQEGERAAGNEKFWGYVWQGVAREALTCNALEWLVSMNGGHIVEDDGTVSIDNPQAIAAIEMAAGWIGDISPPEVLAMAEPDSQQVFASGKAAFMRNWTSFYAPFASEKSPLAGRTALAPLPGGEGGSAGTLGGWQLGVSRHSLKPEEAKALVRWMTSRDIQVRRAIKGGFLPTRISAYDAPELMARAPWMAVARDAFLSATARPSSVAGSRYNEVSAAFATGVHRALRGEVSAESAVQSVEAEILESLKAVRSSGGAP